MLSNKQNTWTTDELHEIYVNGGGDLSRKQMIRRIKESLNDEIVVVNMEGCASLIGFKRGIGK